LIIGAAAFLLYVVLLYWQGDISWGGFTQSLRALFTLQFGLIPPPFASLFVDLLLFGLGGFLWAAFFAHFVLPLRKPQDIPQVLGEMGRTLIGQRPAAIYIENGNARNGASDAARILLLDSASAAVLRTSAAYTRAVGPGLSFARRGEELAGTLDLRKQRRSRGPLPNENPFAAQSDEEDAAGYEARQQRRHETSGLTRDNIEVAVRLQVDLRLEGREGQGNSPFGFHPEFAWRAIANQGVAPQSPSDARGHQVTWDWLAIQLANDLWREYLRKFNLHDLFQLRKGPAEEQINGWELIEHMVQQRLQESIVAEMDESGQMSTRQFSSPEYKLLRGRGVRVLDVKVREIHLEHEEAEKRLVAEWLDAHEQENNEKRKRGVLNRAEKKGIGQQAAALDFARQASAALYERLLKTDGREVPPPSEQETLELLLLGSQGLLGTDAAKLQEFAMRLKESNDE
jgi:hypothetical protein